MPLVSEVVSMADATFSGVKARNVNGITKPTQPLGVEIIDIRRASVEINLKEQITSMFRPSHGPRQLPTLLLYDERGLQLFEEITYLDEYYLTNDEIAILTSSAAEIVKGIPSGSMIIELGSGNLRKVNLLLQALETAEKKVDYFALDLSQTELERTLAQLPKYQHVSCRGLLGTYDDGREWLKVPQNASRQKCILSLGSSIGNFGRDEAADFLRGFSDVLRPGDTMLLGLDRCADPAKVYQAYNDKQGLTHRFVLNGLSHANKVLGQHVFHERDWKVIGEYVYDEEGGRHQAFYSPRRDTFVLGELIRSHDRIQVEQSLKYSEQEAVKLWSQAGTIEIGQWTHSDEYALHLLAKPAMPFSLMPSVYSRTALPTLEDWEAVWDAWDMVTRQMLPEAELLEKPIKLRNACIFYLGHIPTFVDIQLTKTTGDPPTEPRYFYSIFERGIDPDVDNPALCHAHSEIPDEWPPLETILAYQDKVRARLRGLYAGGQANIPRHVGRAIWLGFEHELMHIETLLYMMLQSDKTLPPPQAPQPDFEKLADTARAARVPNKWFDVPAQDINIGIDDPDEGTDPTLDFGWDNEKPSRRVAVPAFQAQGRPVTNGEYAKYLYDENIDKLPASWIEMPGNKATNGFSLDVVGFTNGRSNGYTNGDTNDNSNGYTNGLTTGSSNGHTNGHSNGYSAANGHANGYSNGYTNGTSNGHANGHSEDTFDVPEYFLRDKSVRTVYGPVPLKFAMDWPIFASYDELAGCASYMGGRIPTFEEARSIYAYAEAQKKKEAERHLGKTVPAVNGHLSNDGVEETPPSFAVKPLGATTATDSQLFLDLDGANVGFQRWHPTAVTDRGDRLAGQAELGGVWEWTSTVLRPWDSFAPMAMYPGYTADFFDEKHNIVLGGSWATHPRIAGRKSFVNWYQRNYLYPWVGFRLVRDL